MLQQQSCGLLGGDAVRGSKVLWGRVAEQDLQRGGGGHTQIHVGFALGDAVRGGKVLWGRVTKQYLQGSST